MSRPAAAAGRERKNQEALRVACCLLRNSLTLTDVFCERLVSAPGLSEMRARAGVCAIRCDADLMIGRAAGGASGLVGVGVVGATGRCSRSSLALARKASQKLVKPSVDSRLRSCGYIALLSLLRPGVLE